MVNCPTHDIQMSKGKFSKFCIRCADPKGTNTRDCLKDMKTTNNKWGRRRHVIWRDNGAYGGKTNPGKSAHKRASRGH